MALCNLLHEGDARLIQINREEAMNALSTVLLRDLSEALDAVREDSRARCVILIGAGGRAFCAGADLKERRSMDEGEVRQAVARIRAVVEGFADLPMPTIAAVRGVALGGGLELALACDLRVMAADATVGLTETRLAIIPGAGGTQRLSRLVGAARAKDLIFTGRAISGREAGELGLAQYVAAADDVLAKALALAETIAQGGPIAVRQAKLAIDQGIEVALKDGLLIEQRAYESVIGTSDRVEGLTAFAEKRRPEYKGR
ncbi:MAG: enoyl-CoA hydratase-related protein [Bacilli bacterium]